MIGCWSSASGQIAGAYSAFYWRWLEDPYTKVNGSYSSMPVDGSYWNSDEFNPAKIYFYSGEIISGYPCKLLLLYNRLFSLDDKGQRIEIRGAIQKVEFVDPGKKRTVFERGYAENEKFSMRTYYEVLSEGKVKLLKGIVFISNDHMEYGRGVELKIDRLNYYYVEVGNKIIGITKNEDLNQVFSGWVPEMKGFMERERLSVKKEKELIKIISFYNMLSADTAD